MGGDQAVFVTWGAGVRDGHNDESLVVLQFATCEQDTKRPHLQRCDQPMDPTAPLESHYCSSVSQLKVSAKDSSIVIQHSRGYSLHMWTTNQAWLGPHSFSYMNWKDLPRMHPIFHFGCILKRNFHQGEKLVHCWGSSVKVLWNTSFLCLSTVCSLQTT